METQNNINQGGEIKVSRKSYLKYALIFLAIVLVVGGGYFVWSQYLSPEAKLRRQNEKNIKLYTAWEKNYTEAMKNDTYGGKTPQETLNMFIDALKKGDVELASKYFVLNDAGQTDQKWLDLLNNIKKQNNLQRMADDLEKYDEAKETFKPYYIFIYKNNDGSVGLQIVMRLNTYSQIWKIESL